MSGGRSPEPAPFRVRPATPGDAPALAALERASFSDPWTEATLLAEIGLPRALVLVATKGVAAAEGYAVFRRGHEEAELLRLGVRPERRREGLARALLERGLAGLRAEGFPLCHLEARSANEPALALYRGLGFVQVGFRKSYYRDGTDAVLMSLALTAPSPRDEGSGAP